MVNCLYCGKETTNPKFCSRNCSAKETNKTPKRKLTKKCTQCSSIVRKYTSRFCEHHYQIYLNNKKESLLERSILEYTQRECIKKLHPSSKFAHIRALNRTLNKDKLKLPCYACGYSKHVELAHIRPLRSFPETATIREVNSSNNVIQLCPNCHWEFDNGLLTLAFPEQSESQ